MLMIRKWMGDSLYRYRILFAFCLFPNDLDMSIWDRFLGKLEILIWKIFVLFIKEMYNKYRKLIKDFFFPLLVYNFWEFVVRVRRGILSYYCGNLWDLCASGDFLLKFREFVRCLCVRGFPIMFLVVCRVYIDSDCLVRLQ